MKVSGACKECGGVSGLSIHAKQCTCKTPLQREYEKQYSRFDYHQNKANIIKDNLSHLLRNRVHARDFPKMVRSKGEVPEEYYLLPQEEVVVHGLSVIVVYRSRL